MRVFSDHRRALAGPLLLAARAPALPIHTTYRCPSGEKTVIARSYLAMAAALFWVCPGVLMGRMSERACFFFASRFFISPFPSRSVRLSSLPLYTTMWEFWRSRMSKGKTRHRRRPAGGSEGDEIG